MSDPTLLQETIEKLTEHGKTPNDVCWVGSADGKMAITWKEFEQIASIEYNEGFGGQVVATDLVVVGSSWWLDRGEYDGSEWWNFQRQPVLCHNAVKFSEVASSGCIWETLRQHNGDEA